MTDQTDMTFPWPAARSAAMVGADPARRVAHHVEGPTLLERELPFGRGLATVDRAPTCIGRSTRASAGAGPGRLLRSTRALRGAAATLAIALVVAGCGGAEEIPADAGAAAPTPDSTTPGMVTPGTDGAVPGVGVAGGAAGAEDGMNEIATAQAGNGTPVKLSSRTPKEFSSAHCARPIMVVLHQPGSILDQALLKESRTAAATIKDTKLLVYTPRMVRSYGDLPTKLGLIAAPGVAIVARDGTVENFWTTFVDNKLIEASLRNASTAKACKSDGGAVDAAGVPTAAPSPLATAASLVAGEKVANAGALAAGAATPGVGVASPSAPSLDPAAAAAAPVNATVAVPDMSVNVGTAPSAAQPATTP